MPNFKKFAAKLLDRTIQELESIAAEANASKASSNTTSTPATASVISQRAAPATRRSEPVKVDPAEWVSHCTHESGICANCLAAMTTCIQYAVDAGVSGGFNFNTGQLDRDVAACNNSCPHKLINDCCASCMLKHMNRMTSEVNNLISVSNTAVGSLNSAASGVGAAGSGLDTLRQNLHNQSMTAEALRAAYTQQRMMTPPVLLGGYGGGGGGGGGMWGRQQQQIADGMVWDPPVYATDSAYNQFRW